MSRALLRALAAAVVGLAVLPVLGLALGWFRPPGLLAPPPVTLDRVLPLAGKTLALAACVSALSLALGTWLGWMEQRARYRGVRLLALFSMLPMAVPSYLLATVLREVFAPGGWFGAPLGLTGRFTGFWPSVLALTIGCTPYVQLLVGAALRRFPEAQEEAARSLGAGPWRRFAQVVAPHLRPTWAFALVLVAVYVVSDFGAVAVLDCEVLTWALYKARSGRDAVLLGFGIMAMVLPILVAVRLVEGRLEHAPGASNERSGTRRAPRRSALALTYGLHAVMIGLGFALPVAALTAWTLRGVVHGASFVAIGASVRDTLLFAAAGAVVTVLLALAPAWSNGRRRDRTARLLEHGAYVASGLPGVLVAFGLLQLLLALRRTSPDLPWQALERAGLLLMLGYALRYLATGYAAIKPAVLRLDPRQEESARSLGAGRFRRFLRLSLPGLAPGLAAAFALVFLALLKELPITLLLTPIGSTTLAFRVFDAQREGSLPDVGLAGLVLLTLALGVKLALQRWRTHA